MEGLCKLNVIHFSYSGVRDVTKSRLAAISKSPGSNACFWWDACFCPRNKININFDLLLLAGLEEHNEVVEDELWKLFELNSENEMARTDDDEGYIFDEVNHNMQRPISKREKLFQLLQKLPGQKRRKIKRNKNMKSIQGSEFQGTNARKSSLRQEMKRFADLLEFQRKEQRMKRKPGKSPKPDSRPRGARLTRQRKKSRSVPQKVNSATILKSIHQIFLHFPTHLKYSSTFPLISISARFGESLERPERRWGRFLILQIPFLR